MSSPAASNNDPTTASETASEKVSVIVPSYNRIDTLRQAIRSVIQQTYPDWELIVVDDASTDEAYHALDAEYASDTRIRIVHLPVNMRVVHSSAAAQGMTRQEGLRVATGEYIAFLDDDDFWMPRKLEKQVRLLRAHQWVPRSLMCSTNFVISEQAYTDGAEQQCPLGLVLGHRLPLRLDKSLIRRENFIMNSSVVLHRSLLQHAAFRVGKHEDWRFWLDLLEFTECLYLNEPLVFYFRDSEKHYDYSMCRP